MLIPLVGRIDSTNAATVEEALKTQIDAAEEPVVLDTDHLNYISSAGLRMILRFLKKHPDLKIINAHSEIYEVLDTTGFTEMMTVEKAYPMISLDNCEVIGQGSNGTIYRTGRDSVVKVYNDPQALDDIRHEREVAKLALILGIPTAISYDVVKAGDRFGSVFEFLNARSFASVLASEPTKMDWCVEEYVKLLKKIHGTRVPSGKLPDMKEKVLSWARFIQDYLPEPAGKKLVRLVEEIPCDDHMIHGDYHTRNLVVQNDEVLLIDMETLAVGHPIFELGSMYNSFVGFSEIDQNQILCFQGYDYKTGKAFWKKSLSAYLDTGCEAKIREVEDKARIIGYTRLIRRSLRRKGSETEQRRKELDHWTEELLELLEDTDSLLFSQNELEILAKRENLNDVQAFVEERLEAAACPMRAQMQINLAVEEIFINIASYAYSPGQGRATVRVEVCEDPVSVIITFIDHGVPYDPLKKSDPDVSLPAMERDIGGLGIFMTKKLMDGVAYEYHDGKNILTLTKNLL